MCVGNKRHWVLLTVLVCVMCVWAAAAVRLNSKYLVDQLTVDKCCVSVLSVCFCPNCVCVVLGRMVLVMIKVFSVQSDCD